MKKKLLKRIFLVLLAAFVIIQFIRPDRSNPESDPAKHLFAVEQMPEDVKAIMKTSCLDCHSNNTKWPWYSAINPVGWRVADHVRHGRGELNFSTWADYPEDKKLHKLDECIEEVEKGKMPLSDYLNMHGEAELTDEEEKVLFAWIKGRLGDYEGEEHHDDHDHDDHDH